MTTPTQIDDAKTVHLVSEEQPFWMQVPRHEFIALTTENTRLKEGVAKAIILLLEVVEQHSCPELKCPYCGCHHVECKACHKETTVFLTERIKELERQMSLVMKRNNELECLVKP